MTPEAPRSEAVQRVATALAARGHPHPPRWLELPARTAQEAADALGVAVGQIAKSVVFRRPSDDAVVLVVTSGDRRVDEKRVAALTGPLARADADFVKARTGFSIGGVAPLAHAEAPVTLIDRELFRFQQVWAAAGHPNAVFQLSPEQLRALTGAPVADVVQAAAPPPTPSPCISVCQMDEATGWCSGCLRTLDEIALWSVLDEADKRAVWVELSRRRVEWRRLRAAARVAKRHAMSAALTIKAVDFWFDPISPFAWLAFQRPPQALEGLSVELRYRPVLFAALLQQFGQKGPAEIEPKRQWTFRHVQWLAQQHGIPLQTPAQHPFNPLPLLRLAVACGDGALGPNRRVVEALFQHVWQGAGADAADPARLQALAERLKPQRDPAGDAVKAELRAATDAAIARGVFGVPSFEADGRLFWGLDALSMLAAALRGDAWFEGPAWAEAGAPRPGVIRS